MTVNTIIFIDFLGISKLFRVNSCQYKLSQLFMINLGLKILITES